MKKNYSKLLMLSLLFSLITPGLHAQESFNATGNNISGTGGSTSYSVGQLVYTTNTATNGSVVQGVQQPYEISVVTGLEEAKGINLSISVYPNPTTYNLTLEVKSFELSNLKFQLYDIQGKLLQDEIITDNRTSIDMSNLVPATYFMKVIQSDQEVKTFKIIKK